MKNTINNNKRNESAVYKITNLVNGNYYIGSSKNVILRYRSHLSSLSRGKSSCRILQNAIIKYGILNFRFDIVEYCDNYVERENYYIINLKPKYNIITDNLNSRIFSKETKELMSEVQKERYRNGAISPNKGKKHSEEIKKQISLNRKQYSVISINLITNEIIEFESIKKAKEYYNFGLSSIYHCCLGLRNSVNNVKFIYKTKS